MAEVTLCEFWTRAKEALYKFSWKIHSEINQPLSGVYPAVRKLGLALWGGHMGGEMPGHPPVVAGIPGQRTDMWIKKPFWMPHPNKPLEDQLQLTFLWKPIRDPSENYPAGTSQFSESLEVIINVCFKSLLWGWFITQQQKNETWPRPLFLKGHWERWGEWIPHIKVFMGPDSLRGGQVIYWFIHRPVQAYLQREVKSAGRTDHLQVY